MSEKVELIYIKENNSKKEFELILKEETNYNKESLNVIKEIKKEGKIIYG